MFENHQKFNKWLNILLKKFSYLRQIQFAFNCLPIDPKVFACLQTNCLYLETIRFRKCIFSGITPEVLDSFGRKCGQTLRGLGFESCVWRGSTPEDGILTYQELDQLLLTLLKRTTALKQFYYHSEPIRFLWHNYIRLFITSSVDLLMSLTDINITYGIDYQSIDEFSRKYSKQMKTICLTLNTNDFNTNTDHLNKTLKLISTYESLESLSLTLTIKHKNREKQYLIDEGLDQMSDNLKNLRKFELNLFTNQMK